MAILTPHDYGLLALANSFVNMLVPVIGLGLRQLLSVEFFNYPEEEQKKLVNDIIVTYVCIGTPLLLAVASFVPFCKKTIFSTHASATLITVVFVIIFCQFFVELFYQLLQYYCKAWHLTILQLCVATVSMSVIVAFVWFFHWGAISMLLATMISMFFSMVVALYAYLRASFLPHMNIRESMGKIRHYVTFGIPFIPSILFSWLLASGNRWVLAHYATLHDVGIFAVADIFSQLFYVVILYPFNGSYVPYIFKQYAQNKDSLLCVERLHQRTMWGVMIGLSTTMLICYSITQPILYMLFPAAYHQALAYVPYLLLSAVFWLGQYFAATFVLYNKKSWFLACALIIPATLNMVLTALLTPLLNITGCVIASLISYATFFGLTLWYNHYLQRQYRKNVTHPAGTATSPVHSHEHGADHESPTLQETDQQ
jgi:O-antigen/teichoic acid export membrane protein